MKYKKIHPNLFLAILLLVVSTGPIFALDPEPSPAGGGVLEITKRGGHVSAHDHADFDTHLIDEATIEMWIYLKRAPKFRDSWVLFHKEGSYMVTLSGHTVDLFRKLHPLEPNQVVMLNYHHRLPGGSVGVGDSLDKDRLLLNQWYHLAFIYSEQGYTFYLNGTRVFHGNFRPRHVSNSNLPLSIGGTGIFDTKFLPKDVNVKRRPFIGGLIDEVRVSDIIRYPHAKPEIAFPTDRFDPDGNTLALWHFDGGQANWRQDASGNGHTLIAVDSAYLHVESRGKLATLWGGLKTHEAMSQ